MSKNYEPFVAETSNPTLPVGAIYYDTVIEVCGLYCCLARETFGLEKSRFLLCYMAQSSINSYSKSVVMKVCFSFWHSGLQCWKFWWMFLAKLNVLYFYYAFLQQQTILLCLSSTINVPCFFSNWLLGNIVFLQMFRWYSSFLSCIC